MGIAKLQYSIKKAYLQVITSIAFYPFLIAFGLLSLAWFTSYLDNISVGAKLINIVPALKIDNADTARNLLSSLLTGLISLVTFTFAMVMIVLSQVTSSFSPRLLPDLVSKRGTQVVLGTIIGSICFIIVSLSNIETMSSGPKVPVLSVAVSMYLGFASVLSFIYFIYKISNEIQIGNILNSQYRSTRDALNRELNQENYEHRPEMGKETYLVRAWDSGYFDKITEPQFKNGSSKIGLTTTLLKHQGVYLLKGDPFLQINMPMNDKIKVLLEENILLRHQERVEENLVFGFKHLTEIAVKALSPGINDPGTAITAIDYLLDLLCRLMELRGQKVVRDSKGTARLIYQPIPFEQICYMCIASIRAYSTEDVAVQSRLIDLITKISEHDEQNRYRKLLKGELDAIEEASSKDMKSQVDVQYLKDFIQEVKRERMS